MANTVKFLDDRFIAISGIGKKQTNIDTPLADTDIDTRLKCRIALEDNVDRTIRRDCEDVDRTSEKTNSRTKRLRLTFTSITAQLYALFYAYYLGVAAAPTGSPQNEIQTLSRSGTVNAGFFTLSLTLEGRTATTAPIAYNATATEIEEALTAARMKWIQPGDVSVSGGTKQVETMTVPGGATSDGDLVVTVTAAGSVALAAGKAINVTVANLDTAAQVAGKIRTALGLDADVAAFFTIGGASDQVVLTAKAAAANDTTMDATFPTAQGVTGASTANTTPGVSSELWGGLGMVITFQNRLANANLAQLVVDNAPAGYTAIGGGGSILNTNVQNGSNYFHEFTRSTGREKVYTSFALGWIDDNARDPEKFSGFAVESFTPSANRRQDAGLEVVLIGRFEGTPMVDYTIPDCENPTPMPSADCKVLINNNYETTDISTLSAPFSDNIPLDDSAYGFDGIDPDLLARSKQVDYDVNAQIFAIETDPISVLAENELTQEPVDAKYHFGMPGDRFTILAPETKVKFQSGERFTPVGAAERIAGNFQLSAFKDDQDPPISGEAYISQATAFLTT